MVMLAQASCQYDSGLPSDVMVNTFHFVPVVEAEPTWLAIAGAIHAFYDDTPSAPTTSALRTFMSSVLDPATFRVKLYDLAHAKPRTPVLDINLPLTAVGSSFVPEEVACVLSFEAEPESGVAQARRRNRIYFGPLHSTAVGQVNGRSAPSVSLTDSLIGAAQDLKAASQAAADWNWVVFSPTANEASSPFRCWVDNALDTQRRRGPDATARTTALLTPP